MNMKIASLLVTMVTVAIIVRSAPSFPYAGSPSDFVEQGEQKSEQGHQSSGYGVQNYGDQARFGDTSYEAHAAEGVLGGLKDSGAYGADDAQQSQFGNHGSHTRDRGYGFEKAYAYDRETSFYDSAAEKASHSADYAVQDKVSKHSSGGHGSLGKDQYGNHDSTTGYGYSKQGHDSSSSGKYESSGAKDQKNYGF